MVHTSGRVNDFGGLEQALETKFARTTTGARYGEGELVPFVVDPADPNTGDSVVGVAWRCDNFTVLLRRSSSSLFCEVRFQPEVNREPMDRIPGTSRLGQSLHPNLRLEA